MAESASASTSTLDYAGPSTPRPRRNWARWAAVAALLVVIGLVVAALLPDRAPVHWTRIHCSSSMRQIGLAIQMYMDDNGGELPDTLGRVLETQDITPETFVCAGSQDTRAGGASTQTTPAVVNDLTAGGHLSYVYVGRGLRAPGPNVSLGSDVVILIEPLSNHNGEGMNVLFGDGHAEWITGRAARRITDEANAGVRPVFWPPRKPGTRLATQPPATGPAR